MRCLYATGAIIAGILLISCSPESTGLPDAANGPDQPGMAAAAQEPTQMTVEISPAFSGTAPGQLVPQWVFDQRPVHLLIGQSYDEATRLLTLSLQLRNQWEAPLYRAFRVRLCSLAPRTAEAVNADNGIAGEGAIWDLSQALGDEGILDIGEVSSPIPLQFRMPIVQPAQALKTLRLCFNFRAERGGNYPATPTRVPTPEEVQSAQAIGMISIQYRNAPTAAGLARMNVRYNLRGQWLDAETGLYFAFTNDLDTASTSATAGRVSLDPSVSFAERVPMAIGNAVPSKEIWGNALPATNFPAAWTAEDAAGRKPGQGVVIGFLDTGVDLGHPELRNQIRRAVDARIGGNDPSDNYGHGTSVAGILAGEFNNNYAVGGAYGAQLVSIKIADSRPNLGNFAVYVYDALRGLNEASKATDLDIVNLSWGLPWYATGPASIIAPNTLSIVLSVGNGYLQKLENNGVVVVASAGNTGECSSRSGGVVWPAAYPGVVAVSGTAPTSFSFLDSGSCAGPEVALAAPYQVPSVNLNHQVNGSYMFSGTSASAPLVASALAVIKARHPLPQPGGSALVAELLTRNVKDISSTCPSQQCGKGLLFLEVPQAPPPPGTKTLLYSDDFSQGLSNWVIHNPDGFGSWTTQNNELFGDYNIGCGYYTCYQTQLILADNLQPGTGNWRIEVQSGLVQAYCCYNGGAVGNLAKFALYFSDSQKEAMDIGMSWQGTIAPPTTSTAYYAHQSYPWVQLAYQQVTVPQWSPAGWQTAALEKIGTTYTLYFNNQPLYTFQRNFATPPKVGFSTYGQVRMDNFKLYRLP